MLLPERNLKIVADLDEVAVAQDVLVDELVVDVGAVGRAQVPRMMVLPVLMILAWLRETDSWSTCTSDLDERPMVRAD
jgi:hypothetical protein